MADEDVGVENTGPAMVKSYHINLFFTSYASLYRVQFI